MSPMKSFKNRGCALTEENERHMREALRQRYGMEAYAMLNLSKIDLAIKTTPVVVDGLYSWEEYMFLSNYYRQNFRVVAVWSSPATRYARLSQRPVRPLKLEEAYSRDEAEILQLNKGGPIAMADFTIINEGSLKDLEKETKKTISGHGETALSRPHSDEYFLKVAAVVAERSTCLRHHVGAVAVKDKHHPLSTGYNGVDCLLGVEK